MQAEAFTTPTGPGDTHIFPEAIAWVLLVADLKITNTSIHALYLRRLPDAFQPVLLALHAASCTAIVAATLTVARHLVVAEAYLWEICAETLPVCLGMLLLEITEVRAAWRWTRYGELSHWWAQHHRMTATWLTAEFLAVPTAFLAHDATYLWPYPGLSLPLRLLIQAAPVIGIVALSPKNAQHIAGYQRRMFERVQAA
uniref:Uncharacterized protein n=1 Tax=Eutreptiella gymnastica TaxID=73025 RepID=A0A7S4GA31_9EUGL